ncbi:MAG: ABC transporter transmembrane domain-containing protein, partial [Candidatus Hodarchaeales archaeon]
MKCLTVVVEKAQRTRPTKQLLGQLWGYLGKFWFFLVISGILILTSTIGQIFSPLIISQGLDEAVLSISPDVEFLVTLFIIFLGLSLFVWFANAFNTYILAKVRANMLNDVRRDVFNHLVKADMSYHKKEQSGNVTSRVTSDADELAVGITVFTQASSQLLLTFGTFFLLIWTSWMIAAIALLAIPVAYALARLLGGYGRKIMYRTRKSYGEVSGT